jgi:TolB-like protein
MLLDRPGELITREELQKRLWPADTFVDFEHSLNAAIKRLRAALNDSASAPRYIETLSGRGYRFRAPLHGAPVATATTTVGPAESHATSEMPSGLRQWAWRLAVACALMVIALAVWGWRNWRHGSVSGPRPVIRSLAVLPLENLTGDASQEYFADGMTDALITDLAQIGDLRVISRTSVMRYKGIRKPLPDIARELGVDGIVEGTVVLSGSRVRITSQLIYAPADQHLWARSYERDVGDVVTLQGEVAQAIAEEVRTAMTSEQRSRLFGPHPVNLAAYEPYLRGCFFWNELTEPGLEKAVAYFQTTAEKDPGYGAAHAGLADSYLLLGDLGFLA